MAEDMDLISRAIGNLEGQVRAMAHTVTALIAHWSEQDNKASDDRQALSDRIGEMGHQVDRMENKLDNVAGDVAGFKPTIADYQRSKNEMAGAQALRRVIWSAVVVIAAVLGYLVNVILDHFSTKP